MPKGLAITSTVLPALSLIVTALNSYDIPLLDAFEDTGYIYAFILLAFGVAGILMGWFAKKDSAGKGFAIMGLILGALQTWAAITIIAGLN